MKPLYKYMIDIELQTGQFERLTGQFERLTGLLLSNNG
jgi:hypothetical protein